MSYTQFRDSYKIESNESKPFGTFRTSIITAVGDTCYLFGAVSQESVHPSPVALMRYTPTGYNVKEVGAGLAWKANYELRGMYGLIMQNGILLWAAMGVSSTAGVVHTITPTTDGCRIPSFTINHEQKGSATNEEYQFQGCKIDSLTLVYDMKDAPFLMAKVEWMAAKATDGIALTNDPALPATANTDAYVSFERTWDTGGTPVTITGLQRFEFTVANGLRPVYAHTWDSGTYTGQWVQEFIEAQRKQYRVALYMHPNTVERRMWDSLIATTTAITSTFKFIRSATDYIQITTTGPIVGHQLITPKVGEALLEQVVIEPYAVSIAVSDGVAAASYGE